MQAIKFPPAEDLVISHLSAELPHYGSAATAHGSIPPARPDGYVVVRRAGGARKSIPVGSATLTIECYAPLPTQAADLAELTRAIVTAMQGTVVDDVTVYVVAEISAPQELPDPRTDDPRYTFTVSIDVRGSALERED